MRSSTIRITKISEYVDVQRSYSKKAFPWDNACMESFRYILKREWLNRFKIRDYKQAYRLIFEYLEAFTTRNEFTVIATLCHQMNSSEYIKEHTLRRSCWQVEFGRNSSFQLVLNFDIGPPYLREKAQLPLDFFDKLVSDIRL